MYIYAIKCEMINVCRSLKIIRLFFLKLTRSAGHTTEAKIDGADKPQQHRFDHWWLG